MLKRIVFISFFLSLMFLGCHKDNAVEPFNYDKDVPVWLKAKISLMSSDTANFYYGTKVYRYSWNQVIIYYFSIPLSSCMYCELYDQNGNKVQIVNDAMLQDFLKNRKDEILIWQRNN